MTNLLPFTLTPGKSVTVFLNGVPHAIDNSHPSFDAIVDMLKVGITDWNGVAELEKLISVKAAIETQLAGKNFGDVTVGTDAVFYRGQPINNYLTETMIKLLSDGHDITAWALFMDKLHKNPSRTAVTELFLWLDKAGMPITPDGNFLAYKKVQDDFSSYHKGPRGLVVMNTPGTVVSMERNEVDDVRDRTCSSGLHFCSWHYLPSYYGNKGKVVIVSISPEDVVSVPSDYDNAKGRACKYTVLGVIDEAATQFAFENTTVADLDDTVWDTWDF